MGTTIQADVYSAAKSGLVSLAPHKVDEIRLYSHSDVFYWWPVWALGFVFAFVAYVEGERLAVVPAGTVARRDWRVEIAPGRIETREGLILPPSDAGHARHLRPAAGQMTPGELLAPEQPRVRLA